MRVLFDTGVYNRLADDGDLRRMIEHATMAKTIVVVETHIQDDQLMATSLEERRNRLQETLAATGGQRHSTSGVVWNLSRWGEAEWSDEEASKFYELVLGDTSRGHIGHAADALIATTAFRKADVFVTTDGRLVRSATMAVNQVGGSLEVVTLEQLIARLNAKPTI